VLTAVAVAITVAVLIGFFSVRSEIQRVLSTQDEIQYQRLWIKPQNLRLERSQIYPLALKDKLAAVPGVAKVLYARSMPGKAPDDSWLMLYGASADLIDVDRDLYPVTDAERAAWASERTGVLVSAQLAAKFKLTRGAVWEVKSPKGTVQLKISGIFTRGVPPAVVAMHYEYVDELNGREGVVNDYRLALAKTTDPRPVIEAVDEVMSRFAVHLVSDDVMLELRGVKKSHVVPNLLGALGLILLITTTMGIANSTVISVRERRAELATLRVLGVKRRVLASTVIGESLLVCVIGGLVGAAITWALMRDGLDLNAVFLSNLKMNTTGLVAGLAASVLVPLLGSTFASWLAVRAPLQVALRDVG